MPLRIAVLSTVGTSLLGNLERNIDKLTLRSREVFGNRAKPPSRLPVDDELQRSFEEWSAKGGEVLEDAVKALSKDPAGFSAELNSIIAFIKSLPARHVISELRLQFYPTDTGTSRFCARAITEYLRRFQEDFRGLIGIPAYSALIIDEPIVLKGFGRGVEWFREGLTDLMDRFVSNIVRLRRDGYKVVVNPTGGFKPESAYLTVVAILAGAWRVVYAHETFREVVELPILPITLDSKYVKALSGRPTLDELRSVGLDPEDLRESGVIDIRNGEVEVREWFRRLVGLIG
ncbi:putative CRISPR-associated protein [Vulcanisaeta distributa]|uniref:CRISPR-associated protein, APE2256 family n=1 Tax=Vulcanisaeta distributa (strain DSM 14429 / JCM 11212 / NBRC 100878 / IC-017) TaxID=572478 RepID=E1QQW4_VULDI|nr:putative CRISPR-associated protein [Vulcanisaeta distributa]ADN50534.1 CRISPR-associated protein, APE2256 family [Vulcanisaeta distributa DSM 14429]